MTDNDIRIEIKTESAKASRDIKKLTRDIELMNKRIKQGGRANVGEVGQMTRSFKSLTAHVSKLAIIYGGFHALISGGVKTAQFEQSIKRLGVYSGATAEELALLEEKALGLGESTVFSASQVSDGMNEMALAGLDASQQLDGIEDVLNLASVGMISLSEASNISVTAMKSWGMEASEIGDITDIIAKGSTNSATTVTQLGQALTKVGTVAKSYNVSLAETTASLGVLADAGRRGAEAGTQLKIVMSRLAGNKEANKYIKELGISMYDANTSGLLPFTTQLEIIRDRLKKLSPEAKAIKMSEIFGEEAKSSAIALMVNLEEVHKKLKQIRTAMTDDFASKSAKDMMDTLQGSYKSLMSALEGLTLKMGQELTPILRDVMDNMTEFIRGLDDESIEAFSEVIGYMIESLAELVSVVVDIGGGLSSFAKDNETLIKSLALLAVGVKSFSVGLDLMATSMAMSSKSGGKLVAMLSKIRLFFVANPWALGLIAVATAYSLIDDKISRVNKAREKSVKLTFEEAKETDHLTKRILTYYDKSLNGYYMTNKEREKELKLIGDRINSVSLMIDAGKKEGETDNAWIARKNAMLTSLELLNTMYNKVSTSKDKSIAKTELEMRAWEEFNELPIEQKKNIDKLEKSYNKLHTTAQTALDKLKSQMAGLNADVKRLELEKIEIDRNYYNQKMDLEDAFEQRFKTLRKTNLDEYKTERQTNLDFQQSMLKKEAKAFNELYTGNTSRANKYFDDLLAMSDKLHIGSITSDGKVLASAEQVKKEKLRLAELVYHSKKTLIEAEEKKELDAHIAKLEMKMIEISLLKMQLIAQENYMKKLGSMTDELKKNPIRFDDAKTKESYKVLDKMTSDIAKKLSSLKAQVKTDQATATVKHLQSKINNTKMDAPLGLDTRPAQTDWNRVDKQFKKDPLIATVEGDVRPVMKTVDFAKKQIERTKPKVVPIISDMNGVYIPIMNFFQWLKDEKPEIFITASMERAIEPVNKFINGLRDINAEIMVTANMTNVYTPIVNAINWINSQVVYLDVQTRYHNAGGGYIPQKLATGGVFTGSGRVAGYDPTDSDKVSAMLTGGEYVVKREAVDSYGIGILHAINSMNYPRPQGYATGGQVGSSDSSSTDALQPINLTIGTGGAHKMLAQKDVADALQKELELTGGM